MVLFNYSTRELTAKIVYYGPGLCGKTTNLQFIFENLPGTVKGKMLSLATKTDRTLFFDFLPLDLGEIRGMKTRIQLYTVPGQVFYNETRRLVLKGADGVVFVADSQKEMVDANIDSFKNLEENLRIHSMRLSEMPLVMQFNKRDLPNVASIEQLNETINVHGSPYYESVATTGIGVQDTLKAITKLVLLHLTKKYDARRPVAEEAAQSAFLAATPVAAAGGAGGTSVPIASASASGSAVTPASGPTRLGSISSTPSDVRRDTARVGSSIPLSPPDEEEEVVELTDMEDEDESLELASDDEEPIELTDEIEEPVRRPEAARAARLERELEIEDDEDDPSTMSLTRPPAATPSRPLPPSMPTRASGTSAGTGMAAKSMTSRSGRAILTEPAIEESVELPRLMIGEDQDLSVPVEVEIQGVVRKLVLSIRLRLSEPSRRS